MIGRNSIVNNAEKVFEHTAKSSPKNFLPFREIGNENIQLRRQ